MWPIQHINIYYAYMFSPPIISNPLSNTHVLTYSCSTLLLSWSAWQRTLWSCHCQTTGINVGSISNLCFKHCSSISKSLGGHPQKLSPADTQVCCLPHHFPEGWKCHLCCQNLARHDQHILLCENSKKSTQGHRNEGCDKAKMIFSLQKA